MMPDYHIGSLTSASLNALNDPSTPSDVDAAPRAIFLDPRSWNPVTLVEKVPVSWDTRLFTFSLDYEDQPFGLPTGQHVMARLRDKDGTLLIRAYTPTSHPGDRGTLELLVKVYFDSEKGIPGGRMTQALDRLEPGAKLELKGPIGKFEYFGRGMCQLSGDEKEVNNFVMIAGGSGITPIWQVLRAVLEDPEDQTRCTVIDVNRKEEDILCRGELDQLLNGREHKCTLTHTLTQPSEGWQGKKGRINQELLEEVTGHVDRVRSNAMVLVCGPEAMEKSLKKILTGIGWKEDQLVFF